MKTAISIPNSIYEEAERAARRLRVSRSELYTKALQKYLEAERGDAVTEALNRAYAGEDSSLDPVLDKMQRAVISREEW